MAILITKELALVEDIEFGMDASLQDRGGNQFNSLYLPYSVSQSVTEAINDRYLGAYVEANFAAIGGLTTQLFEVANGTSGFESVNYSQLALKADLSTVNTKADKTSVLELDNDDAFVPSFDYNPATKQYVDGSVSNAFSAGVNGSFTAQSGETVTVINGLITGII